MQLFNQCELKYLGEGRDWFNWVLRLRGKEIKYSTGKGCVKKGHAKVIPIPPRIEDVLVSWYECWMTRYEGPSYPCLMEDRGQDFNDLKAFVNYLEECQAGEDLHKITDCDERKQLRALLERERE